MITEEKLFLFVIETICCDPSSELSRQDGSDEGSQHICLCIIKDGLPYLFHSFRNKYFNKILLGNMLYFQNKL